MTPLNLRSSASPSSSLAYFGSFAVLFSKESVFLLHLSRQVSTFFCKVDSEAIKSVIKWSIRILVCSGDNFLRAEALLKSSVKAHSFPKLVLRFALNSSESTLFA